MTIPGDAVSRLEKHCCVVGKPQTAKPKITCDLTTARTQAPLDLDDNTGVGGNSGDVKKGAGSKPRKNRRKNR